MQHIYENDVFIGMRDGTKVAAVVLRPIEGDAPVLFARTPYGNHESAIPMSGGGAEYQPYAMNLIDAGYAIVWIECRGTHRAEGTFTPVVDEASDANDAMDWIAAQSWCDGRIGTYGYSYVGMAQWAAASTAHPALKAIAPSATAMNWHSGCWYNPGGLLSHSLVAYWHVFMYVAEEIRKVGTGTGDPDLVEELLRAAVAEHDLIRTTTIASNPLVARRWLPELLAHPDYDEFWHPQDFTRSVNKMTAPALVVGGWFDLFVGSQLSDWSRLRRNAGSVEAQEGSRLIVGPWGHEQPTGQYPDASYGPLGNIMTADLTSEHIAFYDRWIKGIEPESPKSPVRIFVMGRNEWRDEKDFPLPDTSYDDYYLAPSDLLVSTPPQDWDLTYDFDPRNPTPTMGGALLPSTFGLVGPVEQGDIANRADVLSFSTPVLTEDTEVTGFVTANLFVSSSALDTDFTAKLIDVHPDGRAVSVCCGALRVRYRNGLGAPELMEPGRIYEIEVPMSVTSMAFLAGHRIRLDVSSSDFPHYDVNGNTGGVIGTELPGDLVIATNTIHGGPARPSRVVLPVIKRG